VISTRIDLGSERGPALEGELATVLALVEAGAGGADAIAAEAGIGAGEAAGALARLELIGYVRCDAVGGVERTPLEAPAEET
jgi:hypothetical protein